MWATSVKNCANDVKNWVTEQEVARIWDACCRRFGPVLACSGCSGLHSHKLRIA
jgi:hypothetical protein